MYGYEKKYLISSSAFTFAFFLLFSFCDIYICVIIVNRIDYSSFISFSSRIRTYSKKSSSCVLLEESLAKLEPKEWEKESYRYRSLLVRYYLVESQIFMLYKKKYFSYSDNHIWCLRVRLFLSFLFFTHNHFSSFANIIRLRMMKCNEIIVFLLSSIE